MIRHSFDLRIDCHKCLVILNQIVSCLLLSMHFTTSTFFFQVVSFHLLLKLCFVHRVGPVRFLFCLFGHAVVFNVLLFLDLLVVVFVRFEKLLVLLVYLVELLGRMF